MTSAQRSRCMSKIKAKDTKPELALRRHLYAEGLRYRIASKLKGKPDLVFKRARVAVFVDGCFWHGCPVHGTRPKSNQGYWAVKLERNRSRDQEVTAALQSDGWTVLRFWDHDIKADICQVAATIKLTLTSNGEKQPPVDYSAA